MAMKQWRYYTIEFKRQVIEELLNGISTPSEACRKYDIDPDILHEWNLQYNMGRFDNGIHGISAPLAYSASDSDLRPSMPSAYIRVLRLFDAVRAESDMAHPGPFISSN
jgi:hypothetical protein